MLPKSSPPGNNARGRDRLLNPAEVTEAGNAREFIRQHGDEIHWVDAWKQWLVWDGSRWKPDATCEVNGLALKFAKEFYSEINSCCTGEGRDGEEFYQKAWSRLVTFAKQTNSSRGIEAFLKLARGQGIALETKQLDSNPYLFNTRNGTFDIKTQCIRAAKQADLITKVANGELNKDAEYPQWRKFLERVLPDPDVRGFVRRAAGMSMIGEQREHLLLVCYGTGANGKGTLLNTLVRMFGDYGHAAPDGMFLEQKHEPHPQQLAALFGKRLVVSSEADQGARLSEAKVKSITGGDPITAHRMRQDDFTFEPSHTIWMACNHKPVIRGTDEGTWRRVMLIPFEEFIPAEQRDPELKNKLEAEFAGILNWCILGLREYVAEGLRPPEAVLAATESYRRTQDTIGQFIDECCEKGHCYEVQTSKLFGMYRSWCERENIKPMSNKSFSPSIEQRGFPRRKTKHCNVFEGLTLIRVEGDGGSSH